MLQKINELKNVDYLYLPELKEFQIKTLEIFDIRKKKSLIAKNIDI